MIAGSGTMYDNGWKVLCMASWLGERVTSLVVYQDYTGIFTLISLQSMHLCDECFVLHSSGHADTGLKR